MCDHCEVTMTYHQTHHNLVCHYCDSHRAVPERCPNCDAADSVLQFFGEGTQQVEEQLRQRYVADRVDRMDRDRLTNPRMHGQILDRFRRGETQILVGTQMIAKGHDFPNVTVVGILNADIGLRIPDFRAAEATFQLLTQVAGRSGRGEHAGRVVVQTYMPEHYSVALAAQHDVAAFVERETRFRRHLFYPPFSHMLQMIVRHRSRERAHDCARWIVAQLERARGANDLVVLGPTKAPVSRLKDIFRYQVLVKSKQRAWMHELCVRVVDAAVSRGLITRTELILDVDPMQFS